LKPGTERLSIYATAICVPKSPCSVARIKNTSLHDVDAALELPSGFEVGTKVNGKIFGLKVVRHERVSVIAIATYIKRPTLIQYALTTWCGHIRRPGLMHVAK